jgi:hypothetical protein
MKFITGKDRDQLEILSLNQVISEENEVILIDLLLQAILSPLDAFIFSKITHILI